MTVTGPDLSNTVVYIDPDGLIGHTPDCPHRVEGGTLVYGPPPFAASCCIDVGTDLDERLRPPEEERPHVTPGAKPTRHGTTEDEWTAEETEEWLSKLGRKAEAADMTPGLVKAIITWLKAYEGTFEFLLDIQDKLGPRGLTDGQAKGVANCWRADINRRTPKTERPETGLNLNEVPSGRYAVPDGDTRLKVQIDNVDSGKWAGWVFVKDGAEYGGHGRYGSQKPGEFYRGKIEDELRAIAADPRAASIAYGKLTGHCGRCGRLLEDEQSIANGIGPVCAQKSGW